MKERVSCGPAGSRWHCARYRVCVLARAMLALARHSRSPLLKGRGARTSSARIVVESSETSAGVARSALRRDLAAPCGESSARARARAGGGGGATTRGGRTQEPPVACAPFTRRPHSEAPSARARPPRPTVRRPRRRRRAAAAPSPPATPPPRPHRAAAAARAPWTRPPSSQPSQRQERGRATRSDAGVSDGVTRGGARRDSTRGRANGIPRL